MKLTSTLLTAALCVSVLPWARAEESVDFDLTIASQYIWRGFDLGKGYDPNKGDNHLHYQPSVNYDSGAGWSFNFWGSYGSDGSPNMDEIDITLDYTFATSEGVDVSVGHIFYDFPTSNGSSTELYAGASWGNAPLAPSLTVYYDYKDTADGGGDGWYAEVGLGKDFELASGPALSAGLTLGYNGGQWGAKSGFSNVALTLGTGCELKGGWSLSPAVTYIVTPEDTVNPDNEFVASLSFSKSL